MKFGSFDFENFKGIAELTLELLPASRDDSSRIVTLVGLNESGKTTILEALDHFVPGQDSDEIKPKHVLGIQKPPPHELIPIARRANFNDDIILSATLALDKNDKAAIAKEVEEETGFRIESLNDSIIVSNIYEYGNSKLKKSRTAWPRVIGSGKVARGRTTKQLDSRQLTAVWRATINAIRNRVPQIWYFPNFLFEFPEQIVLSERADETIVNQMFRSLVQDILDCVGDGMTVAEHIVARALSTEPADRVALNQLRMDIGAEVTRSVVAAWNALFRNSDMNDKRVFVELQTQPSPSGELDVTATFQLEDQGQLFSIRERSLGFRWFFVYLLLTTYRGRRRHGREIVFLFDEPASNLHSSAQSLLLESLRDLSKEAQIIFTTHTPHLVSPDLLESTYVVSNSAVDPTEISLTPTSRGTNIAIQRYAAFANAHPTKTHYFQPVLDVLEYQPSRLEMVPAGVMVEGKMDYYMLRYIELFSGSANLASPLALIPGTGSGSLDLPIRLYLGWARDFIVLLDNDQGGRDARKHYLQKFGETVSDRIIDVSDLSGSQNSTDLASLLSEEDRLQFVRLADPEAGSYTKRLWSLGLEHAVAAGIDVNLSQEGTSRVCAAHAALASRLAAVQDGVHSWINGSSST